MENLFDLGEVKKLIDKVKPRVIFVPDTNVLLRNADVARWRTSLGNPIFVLSMVTCLEIEHLKKKKDEQTSSSVQQTKRMLNRLITQGRLPSGIFQEGIGWFISVASPKKTTLQPVLEELEDMTSAFGPKDIQMLLLTQQLQQLMPSTPVIFLTYDENLATLASMLNLNPHVLRNSLADPSLAEKVESETQQIVPESYQQTELDFAKLLETVKEASVEVELMLREKKTMRDRLLANGTGVINQPRGSKISFLWQVAYLPFAIFLHGQLHGEPLLLCPDDMGDTFIGPIDIDFLGRDTEISNTLREALIQKIKLCTEPWAIEVGLPTLQSPLSIADFFLGEVFGEDEELTGVDVEQLSKSEREALFKKNV